MKKYILAVVLAAAISGAACAESWPARNDRGYYIIENEEQLKWFRDAVNDGATELNALLAADIDLGGQAWVPVGRSEEVAYNGTFDGQGHLISGLSVFGERLSGLFGAADFGSGIANIRLRGANIFFTGDGEANAGVVVGLTRGIVQDCVVEKSILRIAAGEREPRAIYAGGVVGTSEEGVVIGCVSRYNQIRLLNASPENGQNAAASGICGVNIGTLPGIGLIMNCESQSVEIVLDIGASAMNAYGGGIVGLALGGIIRQCATLGGKIEAREFAGNSSGLGGVIGSSMLGSYIENCRVEGDLIILADGGSTEVNLGATAGDLLGSSLSGCRVKDVILSASGAVPHNLGGIAGVFSSGKISGCCVANLMLPTDRAGLYNVGAVAGVVLDIDIFGEKGETIIEETFFQQTIAGGRPFGIYGATGEAGALPVDRAISHDIW